MSERRARLGRKGEDIAARVLERQGCTVIARNHRTPFGEIDLIAKDGDEVVFVEVKTRHDRRYGAPEEAITWRKRQHLRAAAACWLARAGAEVERWRIDVISLTRDPDGAWRARWLKSAVGEG